MRYLRLFFYICVLFFSVAAIHASSSAVVRVIPIQGVINPIVAEFVSQHIAEANAANERAILLFMDTPGGLDTAMRDIIQSILVSSVPVIVHVAPSGARAASAGALITLAADFAVMAPGTNIGAAHPVAIGVGAGGAGGDDNPMMEKVTNDAAAYARSVAEQRGRSVDWAEKIVRDSLSSTAEDVLRLRVIDAIAADRQRVMEVLDGSTYLRDGKPLIFDGTDVVFSEVEMPLRERLLNVLSQPDVAYLLLMLGFMGIFFEISQPGVILPGVVGVISLLLAFFAFQTLPINYVGMLLILVAMVMFILEVTVVSYGMLTVGGVLALTLGSLMLVDSPDPLLRISIEVIGATVLAILSCLGLVILFVMKSQRRVPVSGLEGLIGEVGVALAELDLEGRVFVHGEHWDAIASQKVAEGDPIEVVEVTELLTLRVRPVDVETDKTLTE